MSFYPFFIILFLFSSTIAMKYNCKSSKDHASGSHVTSIVVGKKLNNVCRYKFLSVFLNSFFILLYYSYKMSKNI